MVWEESNYVIERDNNRLITETQLIRDAMWGLLSAKGGNAYGDSVGKINYEVVPALKPKEQDADEWPEKT